jgi:hypothetical protein
LQYGRINGDPFSNVGWRVRNKGPKFSHGLAVVSTILCEMKDPRSIKKWTPNRPVEELVPTLTGASVQTAMLMLGHRIKFSARKRRTWNYNRVTIPNRLFRVGSFVRIRDENTPLLKKSMNVYAQIREIAYNGSVDSDDMRGNCFCGVLPVQYVRPREELAI